MQLNTADNDYTVKADQKFLLVQGTNLKTTSGASYLWWLNGVNKGSQVVPTTTKTITVDGEKATVIAWDMTKSGLAGNNSCDPFSVCQGMTIFGLTSTTGTSTISYIGFESSVDDYLATTGITSVSTAGNATSHGVYTIQGVKLNSDTKDNIATDNMPNGIYIVDGKKVVKR